MTNTITKDQNDEIVDQLALAYAPNVKNDPVYKDLWHNTFLNRDFDCMLEALNLFVEEVAKIGYGENVIAIFNKYYYQAKSQNVSYDNSENKTGHVYPRITWIRDKNGKPLYAQEKFDASERHLEALGFKLYLSLLRWGGWKASQNSLGASMRAYDTHKPELISDIREALEKKCDVLDLPKYARVKEAMIKEDPSNKHYKIMVRRNFINGRDEDKSRR